MRRFYSWLIPIMLLVALPAVSAKASQRVATAALSGPVNVNTASQADLETLPGVGAATARKIIDGRPYSAVTDLSKAGVPKSTIDKIASMVTTGSVSSRPHSPAAVATPVAQAQRTAAPESSPEPTSPTQSAGQQPPTKGMVWVNLETKVFHKEGDRYYGKTKNGKFMSESDALQAGYREAKTGSKAPSK